MIHDTYTHDTHDTHIHACDTPMYMYIHSGNGHKACNVTANASIASSVRQVKYVGKQNENRAPLNVFTPI